MYFLLFKLYGWSKRFAAQPQPNCSELPQKKRAFASCKRQRRENLCGTTLVPDFSGAFIALYRARPAQPTDLLEVLGALLGGDKPGGARCLAPSGSSLKSGIPRLLSSSMRCQSYPVTGVFQTGGKNLRLVPDPDQKGWRLDSGY